MNLFSCNPSYKLVTEKEIDTSFKLNSSPTFQGYFYQGSDESYHYFIGKWKLRQHEFFKIEKVNLTIEKEYSFSNNVLQVSLIESDETFGYSTNFKLYIK